MFVEESEDLETERLLGRFNARFERAWRRTTDAAEDLPIDDAIAWGKARAGLVLVRFGRRVEIWSAGATPHWSYPPWPPPDLPPLVPRPIPRDDWRSVGGAGSQLMWAVTIRLTPERVLAGLGVDQRETWDIAVASAAAVQGLAWDRRLPAYRVYAVEPALRPADAERAAAAGFTPPSGFRVDYSARPADLSEL